MSSVIRVLLGSLSLLAASSLSLADEPAAEKKPEAAKPEAGTADPFPLLAGQNIIPHYAVPFAEKNGTKLTADIYLPKGEGPFPGIVLIHGGAWTIGSSATVMGHGQKFAALGYSVAAINYRKAPKDKFPAQLEDTRDAIAWFRKEAKQFKLDPERIGLWGYSAGGHLAALAAVTEVDTPGMPRVRCVAAGGAPVDFTGLPADNVSLAYWLGGSRKDLPEIYRQASPLGFVTKDDPPFLFFHGEKDQLVPKAGVQQMVAKLKEVGVSAEYYEVPKAEHILAHWDKGAFQEAVKFFDRVLKKPM